MDLTSNKLKVSPVALVLTSFCGCAATEVESAPAKWCTDDWYSVVETQVLTGDGSGHGPDLGSGEWRSVVEFKLGIRGNPGIPDKSTDQWCEYIDTHYIKSRS